MEEQMKRLDKMAAINQLAAGMAHEIRNPLTSLSGSIQMLKSELTLQCPSGASDGHHPPGIGEAQCLDHRFSALCPTSQNR